jgi:hypothetical protein
LIQKGLEDLHFLSRKENEKVTMPYLRHLHTGPCSLLWLQMVWNVTDNDDLLGGESEETNKQKKDGQDKISSDIDFISMPHG